MHTANDGGESDDSCSSDDSTSSIDIDGLQSDPSGNSDLDEFDTEDLKKELMQLKDELPSDPGVTDSVVSMGEGVELFSDSIICIFNVNIKHIQLSYLTYDLPVVGRGR